MKIKRFYARTMRAALQQVREEQGPDAVILSKRRVPEGIEVIAAVDYDEALLHQSASLHGAAQPEPGGFRMDRWRSQPAAPEDPQAEGPAAGARAVSAFEAARREAFREALESGDGSSEDTRYAGADAPRTEAVTHPKPTAEPAAHRNTPATDADTTGAFAADSPITVLPEPGSAVSPASLQALAQSMASLRASLEGQYAELKWDDLQRREPKLAEVIHRLTLMGLGRPLVESIVAGLGRHQDQQQVWRTAIGMLAKRLPLATGDVCEEGGIFALVGATGSGKTTGIARLAARFALGHGPEQIGLITTDGLRIGAQEQLFRFGRILGVPVQVAATARILAATLDQLADKKLVLIDTAGFNPRDREMFARLEALTRPSPTIQTLLTLPANAQTECLRESIRVFDRLGLDGAIATKLDEATSLGGLLSTVIDHDLALCYVTDGQRIPEDIRPAFRYRAGFVSQAVSLARRYAMAGANDGEGAEANTPTEANQEPQMQGKTPTGVSPLITDTRVAAHG